MRSRSFRRCLALLLAFATLVHAASATWSVVAVDLQTREVCVSSATCLANFNLKRNAAVVVPGFGGAMAQSLVDVTGMNRQVIHAGLANGDTAADILAAVIAADLNPNQRQYGIVTFDDEATFTGTLAGQARHGVAGAVGRYRYAIQGNLLTGAQVVTAAETAFRTTAGDVSARVMAAMEAAAALGGDGRCSCDLAPTACGVPPPNQQYSAFTAFLVLARPDSPIGPCNQSTGCATGPYELDLNVISFNGGVEPVEELRRQYALWRQTAENRPHPGLTRVEPVTQSLVADGRSSTFVRIRPINLDGEQITPIVIGNVELGLQSPGPAAATMGPVGWHGFDRFGFLMTAGSQPGEGTWSVTLVQGQRRDLLLAELALRVDPLAPLHVGHDEVDAGAATDVTFHVNLAPADAGLGYLLVGTSAGSAASTPFGSVSLPLAWSPFMRVSVRNADSGPFLDTAGVLDADGRAVAALRSVPGLLAPWAPGRLDWAVVVFGSPARVFGPVGFDLR